MNKALLYLFSALLLLACGGGDDGGGGSTGGSEFLNVNNNNTTLTIPGDNMQATLTIQASPNCEWTILWDSSSAPWIQRLSSTTGRGSQVVEIRVSTNPSSTQKREALLTIRNASGSIVRTVNLVQSASTETLELSVYEQPLGYEAGRTEVRVISNTQWTVTGMTNWLTVSPTSGNGDGNVTISYAENTTEQPLSATLTFTGSGGTSRQLKLTQTGRPTDFTVSPTSLTAEAKASTVQFIVTGEARWIVKTNQDWARPDIDTPGEGNKTITVTLDDNTKEQQRTAVITVSLATNTSKFEEVAITQKAATKPDISNMTCSDVTRHEATVSFNYTSMYPVTEYGVCYSLDANPTINDTYTMESGVTTQGSYTKKLTGLTAGKTYYLRAYAKSVVDITYSNNIKFTTKQGDLPNSGDNQEPGW